MSLTTHDPSYRRIWMFPRNIRRIYPWKLMQIISLLKQQTDYKEWSGNQILQNQFIKALDQASLKRPTNIRDPNSGGARTYLSQLQCLGLIYKKDNNFELTLAGEDIQNAQNPLTVLQTMLLRHQYPSNYSGSFNVKIHPGIKVKPFLLVLKILNDPDINTLTNDELIIPVIYGHNFDCLELCKEKIVRYRENEGLMSLINNPAEDLYTPRSVRRSEKKALEDIRNIANTCKNYLQSACLVNSQRIDKNETIAFNTEFRDLYEAELKNAEIFIRNPDVSESFQRAYGTWNRQKDNRAISETRSVSGGENIIIASFMDYCGKNMVLEEVSDFIKHMRKQFGFSEALISEVVEPYQKETLSIFKSTYLQLSTGGTSTAAEFEKTTGKLFKERLNFEVEHTGQKHRAGTGGYSDLYLIEHSGYLCAIIDTKASPEYALSTSDFYKLIANYIPNYRELSGGSDHALEFCSYVAGGFKGGIESRLAEAEKKTSIPVSGISAKKFLDLCNDPIKSKNQVRIRRGFSQSKILQLQDF